MQLITRKSDCKKYTGTDHLVANKSSANNNQDHAMKCCIVITAQHTTLIPYDERLFKAIADDSVSKN